MTNTSEHPLLWRLLIFAPTIIGLLYFTSKLPLSTGFLIAWCVLNAVCSFAAAWTVMKGGSLFKRVMLALVTGGIFWVINLFITVFGGCVCKTGMVPL